MSAARRITIERRSYSRAPWRLLDSETGSEVTFPVVFEHPYLGKTVIHEAGFDSKRAALAFLGELAARSLRPPRIDQATSPQSAGVAKRDAMTVVFEQFIITGGDYHDGMPVGPFSSEEEAHAYYQSNQPHSKEHPYLRPPTIVRLLRPCPGHPKQRAASESSRGDV